MRPHLSRLPMKLRSSLHRTLRRPTRPGVAFALSAPVLTSRPGSRTGFVVLAIAIVGFGLVGLTGCGGGDTEAVPPMPELPDAPVLRFSGRPLEWAGEACESAILIEAETGTILYEKNSHDRRPPASIAKMMLELGEDPSAAAVARRYRGLVDLLVVEEGDGFAADELGVQVHETSTIMRTLADKRRLAAEVLERGEDQCG